MDDNRMPWKVSPPGRILRLELEARGWTQKDLAAITGRPEQAISEIINVEKQITPQTAIELSEAFGISAQFWINLEANYQLWLAHQRDDGGTIARRARLYTLVPLAEIRKRGWIRDTPNLAENEKDVLSLLEIKSIEENPTCEVSLRASRDSEPESKALLVWIKRVKQLVKRQKVGKFSKASLENELPGLLARSPDIRNLADVPSFLMDMGIRFALVPPLSRTYLDGAVFRLNGEPVVALTLRYDRVDSFWFTLMHELAHLVADHKGAFLDTIYGREGIVSRKEIAADRLARNWLVDQRQYDAFVQRTRPYFTGAKIRKFAESIGRHPSIVLGRLQFDGEVKWGRLASLHEKVKPILHEYFDKPIRA